MDNDLPYTTAFDLLDEYKPKEVKKSQSREEAIYVMAQTSGWMEIKKVIEDYISSLEAINIQPTDSVTAVGYKYLSSRTAITYLESIIKYVQTTFDTVEADRQKENGK